MSYTSDAAPTPAPPPPVSDAEFATRCYRIAAVIGSLPKALDDLRRRHPESDPVPIYYGPSADALVAALRCVGWPGEWRIERGPNGSDRVYPVSLRGPRNV